MDKERWFSGKRVQWAKIRRERKNRQKRWTVVDQAHYRRLMPKSKAWCVWLRKKRQRRGKWLVPLALKRLHAERERHGKFNQQA